MLRGPASIKAVYSVRNFWAFSASFIRFSVLCLYYRLIDACKAPPHYFWAMHCTTIVTIAVFVCNGITGIIPYVYGFQFSAFLLLPSLTDADFGRPIHTYWAAAAQKTAKCINDGAAMQAAVVLNTFA